MARLTARSISNSVRARLCQGVSAARVLSVHRQACNLVTPNGQVIALVAPSIGDGPLNIVLGDREDPFAGIAPHAKAMLEPESLVLDGLEVGLERAAIWEPRPDWDVLRARYAPAMLVDAMSTLRRLGIPYVLPSLFSPLVGGIQASVRGFAAASWRQARQAVADLRAGWKGDLERLREGTYKLAGLGYGLTPSGDDLLVGLMLRAWLAHSDPLALCQTIVTAAVPRTTALSAAYLRAAAQGQCSVAWHALFDALFRGQERRTATAMHKVLEHGATSGADSLIGFLYTSGAPG